MTVTTTVTAMGTTTSRWCAPQPDDVDGGYDADEVGRDGTDDSAPDDRTDGDTDSGGNDD